MDGFWFFWGGWGICNVICGGGICLCNWVCDGFYFGGKLCEGEDEDLSSCNDFLCLSKILFNILFIWN